MTDGAEAHIAAIEDPRRRSEAQELDRLFREVTGFAPRLWSGKMIGYGSYNYTYESGHSGRWFATGFAAPKRALTIYVMPGYAPFPDLMKRLGKHRLGKSCLYVARLENIDRTVLAELVAAGLDDLGTRWDVHPT